MEVNNEDGGEMNADGVKINLTEQSEIQDSKLSGVDVKESKIEDSKIANSKLDPKASNIVNNSTLKVSNSNNVNDSKNPQNSKLNASKVAEGSKFSTSNNKSNFGKSAKNNDANQKKSKIDEKNNKSNVNEKKDQNNGPQANKDGKKPGENEKKDGQVNKDGKVEKDKDGKDKVDDKKDDNNDDFENQRTQKLMNSKDNNRKIVVFQFAFIAILFIIYFVVDFILELNYLNDVRQSYSHLRLVSQRPSIVKYTVVFTIEQLATSTIQTQNSEVFTNGIKIDVRDKYTNLIYDNERDIFESMTQTFPSNFDTYQTIFEKYNYDDLCQNYYTLIGATQMTSNL